MADAARVLLVQDDQSHAQALAEALTRSGHSVERAASDRGGARSGWRASRSTS